MANLFSRGAVRDMARSEFGSGKLTQVQYEQAKRKLMEARRKYYDSVPRAIRLAMYDARLYVVGALRGTGKGAEVVGAAAAPRQNYSFILSRALHKVRHPQRWLEGQYADKKFFFVRMQGNNFGYMSPVQGGVKTAMRRLELGHEGYNGSTSPGYQTDVARIGWLLKRIPNQLIDKDYRHQMHRRGFSYGNISTPKNQKPRPIFEILQKFVRDKFPKDLEKIKQKMLEGRI